MKIAKIRNSRSGISVAENKNEEQHSRQSFYITLRAKMEK